jgi:hypothetical protein
MNIQFVNQLAYALMADYFNVSFMTTSGRGQGLDLMCSKFVFSQLQHLLIHLGADIKVFQHTENMNFVWIEFNTIEAKQLVEEYFESFNFANRKNEMIAMPNVFEGEMVAKQFICNWYLDAIETFFMNDFEGVISIPQGVSEDDINERLFMLYDKDGLKGLFKGSQVFTKSPIKFVNFQG